MPRTSMLLLFFALAGLACDSTGHYTGVGQVVSVDSDSHHVSIRHDGIAGLSPSGTSRFAFSSGDVQQVLVPGATIRFQLQSRDGNVELTQATLLSEGNPGVHDHTPHHGGVVAMTGMIHLEAKASPQGSIRLYLTDLWRRPISPREASGSITLDLPGGKETLPLAAENEALAANGPPLSGKDVLVHFALHRGGESIDTSFLLPLGSAEGGAAGVPTSRCAPFTGGAPSQRSPRCAMSFEKPVAALAISPDASDLLVAIVDLGVSDWRLPAGELAFGFAPPPPIAIPVAEPPHAEAPNAVRVRPGGHEALVALEKRLLLYDMTNGRLLRAMDGPSGILRDAVYSPDGTEILASCFYDPAAYLLDASDARTLRKLSVEREGAGVAFARDGQTIALASETGPISLFDAVASTPTRRLEAPYGASHIVRIAGDVVIAAGDEKILRGWTRGTGALRYAQPLGGTVDEIAVSPGETMIALTAGNRVEIRRVDDGSFVDSLVAHDATVSGLAWGGSTIASGDVDGKVFLWNASQE